MATPVFPSISIGPGISFGTEENDLFSGSGNNVLYLLGGDDGVRLGGGNDQLFGGEGNDLIFDYSGNNALYGGDGNDTVIGGEGFDVIFGGEGNDNLLGGGGTDVIYGGSGDDFIYGQEGDDILYGQSGFDTFVYTGNDGVDVINGFNLEEDTILLTANINDTGIASPADLGGRILDDEASAIVDLGADSYIQLTGVSQEDVVGNLDSVFAIA